ncbi:hypothetical protein [Sinobaca sp. H24]|nr:hypothetical protein [Sinobaca sp. H24]
MNKKAGTLFIVMLLALTVFLAAAVAGVTIILPLPKPWIIL